MKRKYPNIHGIVIDLIKNDTGDSSSGFISLTNIIEASIDKCKEIE